MQSSPTVIRPGAYLVNEDTTLAKAAVARRVFGERAAFYRTSPAHTDPNVLARLVEMASPRPEWIVLDLATGAGHTALTLASKVRQVIAYDLTQAMLAEAANLIRDRSVAGIVLSRGDAHHLPFESGVFDLLTCRRAAHHFADLPQALDEMRRVLRPGGRLVIDDRSVPKDARVEALMNRLDTLHDPSHVWEYPAEAWKTKLAAAGFVLEQSESYQRLRPLRDLTQGALESDAREILRLVEAMPPDIAGAFGRARVEGDWHLTHSYEMLAAVRC